MILSLTKLEKQYRYWLIYSICTPAIFGFIAIIILMGKYDVLHIVHWVYSIAIIITMAAWWCWTMSVIYQITKTYRSLSESLSEVSSDIKDIKNSILTKK
jgi:hypothetical protein